MSATFFLKTIRKKRRPETNMKVGKIWDVLYGHAVLEYKLNIKKF
jgi:hypothetical protein